MIRLRVLDELRAGYSNSISLFLHHISNTFELNLANYPCQYLLVCLAMIFPDPIPV